MLFLCSENEVRHPDICRFNRASHPGSQVPARKMNIYVEWKIKVK
jgi:hypothetical protein